MESIKELVNNLRELPDEKGWLEFKHNNYTPKMIGEDISALANAAALADRNFAYMIWGVDDTTHEIVGTDKNLQNLRQGGEELENWLRHQLSRNADFTFQLVDMENLKGESVKVGVLTVYPAVNMPVMFEKVDYVRVGSYTKKLVDYPALQSRLWDKLHGTNFETQVAQSELTLPDVLDTLNVSAYYNRLGKPMPMSASNIEHDLCEDELLIKEDSGRYSITNLGALLLAKRMSQFGHLSRKAVRVIQHKDASRLQMLKDETFDEGYAVCFDKIEQHLKALLPSEEVIGDDGIRRTVSKYPMLAIREATANMCIHQDMTLKGSSLLIEVFDDWIEFTNPGSLLVDVMRIVDNPPRSRNEKVAALMRRFNICEEAGSGWDKMVKECELMNMPSPKVIKYEENTRVVVYAKRPFNAMTLEEKVWACYLHACIQYLTLQPCTNATVRTRFGLSPTQQSQASRLIKECVTQKLIKPLDPETAPKHMSYVPMWV
ncbi:MAG: putative DNA binding domain-containing protein [Bacteroidaceae bacterium]|nr:putative DNA binding domain-containing protein [Bacteroidaceae bacterium]